MKVVKREAVFIPIKDITPQIQDRIKDKLTFNFFGKEKICEECEWVAERVNDVCESCANFKGQYQLASQVKLGSSKYLKIPVGSSPEILRLIEDRGIEVEIRDMSPSTRVKPFKFKGKYRPGQVEAIKAMLKFKRGVLRAPPRSGKTVMGSSLVCHLSRKTLILASQRDWLMGFKETFVGSDTQPALTDLDPKRIKLCKTLEDFKTHDVCLATVQTFYSPGGEKLLKAIRDWFDVILVDECFPAGTMVATDRGPRPIEELVEHFNDVRVLSYNHDTNTWEFKQVTNGFKKKTTKKLLRIKTELGEFTCTEDHEIFSVALGKYVQAKDLALGDELLSGLEESTHRGPAQL